MLSLAKLGARKKDELPKEPENPPPEFDSFIKMLNKTSVKKGADFLLNELLNRSKEQGQSTDFLRMILTWNSRLHLSDSEISVICCQTILTALFEMTYRDCWSFPKTLVADLMSQGQDSVRCFPSRAIAPTLSMFCLTCMRDSEDKNLPSRWIDLFVKCVSVLVGRGNIEHDGDVIDGKSFRSSMVTEICRMDWSKTIISSLVIVLEEMLNLTSETAEVDLILDQLDLSLKNMRPTVVPSILNSIVTIAGRVRSARLIEICDKYFEPLKLDKTTKIVGAKISIREVDNPEIVAKRAALGNVAFHFVEAARHCEPIVREILKRVKASIFDHSLVMTPFTLAVVLGMTSVDYLRVSIVDPMKTAIIKSFHELNLSKASRWYKETRGEISDEIFECFEIVLGNKSNTLEYMSDGLKDLGISLISVDTLQSKYPMTSKKCKELGSSLITMIIMNNKEYLALLMKDLLKMDSVAHIECLAACLSKCSRAVSHRDFQGRISELMHHLPAMSVKTSSIIVKALMPALQISQMLLDELMMVLRKTFWKSVESGCVCVEVMCVVLSNSLIVGNSQCNFGGNMGLDDLIFSQYTQAPVPRSDIDFSPLCHEILSLAQRCFSMDSKVREQLYLGLHRVSRRNPPLSDIICGHLSVHESQYKFDASTVSYKPLFEFFSTDLNHVKVKDELGFLVQCLGFVFNKFHEVVRYKEKPASYTSCKKALDEWIEFVCTIKADRIEIIAASLLQATNITRPPAVSKYVKDVLVMQTMQVIEALIEFIAIADEWSNAKRKVSMLFKNYIELECYSKEQALAPKKGKGTTEKGKGKKKAKDKKVDDKANDSDNDTSSIVSGSDNLNAPSSKIRKEGALPKVQHYHIINLDSVCYMLRKIYGPDNESQALSKVKSQEEFEKLLLKTVKTKVNRLKNNESIRERERAPRDISNALTCLVETIWERMCRLEVMFKDQESIYETKDLIEARLEVITVILERFYEEGHLDRIIYFNKYRKLHKKVLILLAGICPRNVNLVNTIQIENKDKEEEISCLTLFEQWKKVLEMTTEIFDGVSGYSNQEMFAILNSVCKSMNSMNVLDKIQAWSWNYLKKDDPDKEGSVDLLDNVVNVYITCYVKFFPYPASVQGTTFIGIVKLAKAVRIVLGDVDGEKFDRREASWLIKEPFAPKLFCNLTVFVGHQLEIVNTILGRLKSHRQYIGAVRSSAMREKCFKMIDCLRVICTELVSTSFPAGPCVTTILKLIPQIYVTMTGFAEYLLDIFRIEGEGNISFLSFKQLVMDLGKDFKPKVEYMIHHIELVQRKKCTETSNKGSKGQISKDGKLIPNLVYHVEKFEQQIIALSTKAKIDLLIGMKLSTSRDFRIETDKLMEASTEKNKTTKSRPGTSATLRSSSPNETGSNSPPNQEPSISAGVKRGRKRKQN